jgi:hypothetical protein
MKLGVKLILVLLNVALTLLTQKIYDYTPGGDSIRYYELAKQYSQLNFYDPLTNCVARPFYPVFLAIIGNLITYNYYFIAIMQSLIFCFASFLFVTELEKFLQRKLTGVLILLFLIPEIHYFNGFIITESLGYSLILLAFYYTLKIYNSGITTSRLFILSFIIALSVLNRSESIVIFLPIFYFIYPKIKTRLVSSILICISLPILLLQLNGIKNYKIYGIYQLSAFNGGETIFAGNSENLDGSHHDFQNHKEVFIPKDRIDDLDSILAQPQCFSCPQQDTFFFHLAVEAWKKDPVKQLGVIPEKMAKNWLLPGNFDIYTNDTTKARGLQLKKILSKEYFNNAWYAPYKHLFYMMIHWSLLALVCIGLFQMKRQNRLQVAVLMLFIMYLLFAIPFSGLPRWHVTIFPLLIITFIPSFVVEKLNRILDKLSSR